MKIIEVSENCKFVEENFVLTKPFIFGINEAVNNQMKSKKENLALQTNTYICNRILKMKRNSQPTKIKMIAQLTNCILSNLNPRSPGI